MLSKAIQRRRRVKMHSEETKRAARELVESGGTLQATAMQTGIAYSTLQHWSELECWALKHPTKRATGRPRVFYPGRVKAIETALEREEALMLAEESLAKSADLEIMARGCLIRDSERAKLGLSRLINRTIEELGNPEIKPRDRAKGLGALSPVIKLVYRWHEEPSIEQMERAQSGMINLTLQATDPHDLKRLALARHGGSAPEPEQDGQGGGPSPIRPEHAPTGGDGLDDRKGDPEEPGGEKQGHPEKAFKPNTDREKLKPEWDSILAPQVTHPPESQPPKDGQKGYPREQARKESRQRGW
jgi:transposase-like protein